MNSLKDSRIETFCKKRRLSVGLKKNIINFLFQSLGRFGDPKEQIEGAIAYAQEDVKSFGGFIKVVFHGEKIIGALVLNRTGMAGYIPENILVYIAVDPAYRGRGIGGRLISETKEETEGAIALHVEPDNPALHLYERKGFANKYLEMRHC